MIIFFLVFGLAGVYLLIGISYKAFYMHAKGIKVLPNYDFWYRISKIIKEKLNFGQMKITFNKSNTLTVYESIGNIAL